MARAALAVALVFAAAAAAILFWQAPAPAEVRDRIVPASLPAPDRIAVVAFGTSLTARAHWPARIEAALVGCGFSGARVTVQARPGANSAEGMAMVGSEDVAPYHVAVIEFAINDADILDGVSQADSLKNHRSIIRSLRARNPGIAVVLLTTNPVAGLRRMQRPKLMAYDDLYVRLADEEDLNLFDGSARWAADAAARAALPDGLHPDPETEARLYAQPLAAVVAQIYGRRCSP